MAGGEGEVAGAAEPASPAGDHAAQPAAQLSQEAMDEIATRSLQLSEAFLELTGSLRQAVGDAMGNTLEHLLVQEAAAERVQVRWKLRDAG